MEILIGLIASGITEVIKILSDKYGVELSKKIVHGIVLSLCCVGTFMVTRGIISWDMVQSYVAIFTSSYTVYRLLINPAKVQLGLKK